MREQANGRRVYALTDYTVERKSKGWYYGRTSRFGDAHVMKGHAQTSAAALMIACEFINEILKREFPIPAPHMTGSRFLFAPSTQGCAIVLLPPIMQQ